MSSSASSSSSTAGGLSTRIPQEPSVNPLTIRVAQPPAPPPTTSTSTSKNQPIDDRRLYIGNLDPTIDEYTLLKLFSPFGKVTKLDFMFHYSGPKKGTPRGYCFLDYEASSQAAVAIKQMNRRSLKNRPLIVSLANIAPPSTDHQDGRKRTHDPNRPTAFSILKSGALKNASTDEKIKAMERKLAQMSESSTSGASASAHPSLPSRPASAGSGAGSSSSRTSAHRGAGAGSNSSARQRPY
ncbi:hypothetical protein EC957_001214 [Mortierella hygrophila]|uniref:Probable RNA-binding protein 18 n=1 Tax=Mortierella hygrophila TaxID=979708 RepID=A0A9P6K2T0_9FUNG|nr:hypothetical protein EC957_001214 [Mortierella hygrophila]